MSIREFLTQRGVNRETVEVDIGGQKIRLRALTVGERIDIQASYRDEKGEDDGADAPAKRQALYTARSIVDEAGALVFSESEADLKLLMGLSSYDMGLLDQAITKLNFPPKQTEKN